MASAWRAVHTSKTMTSSVSDSETTRIAPGIGGSVERALLVCAQPQPRRERLALTAPGIPMLFMGQEFLEDKHWSDSPNLADTSIDWDGARRGDGRRRTICALRGNLIAVPQISGAAGEGCAISTCTTSTACSPSIAGSRARRRRRGGS